MLSNRFQRQGSWVGLPIQNHGKRELAKYEADQSEPNLRSVGEGDVPGRLPTALESAMAEKRRGYHVRKAVTKGPTEAQERLNHAASLRTHAKSN